METRIIVLLKLDNLKTNKFSKVCWLQDHQ